MQFKNFLWSPLDFSESGFMICMLTTNGILSPPQCEIGRKFGWCPTVCELVEQCSLSQPKTRIVPVERGSLDDLLPTT